LQSFMAFLYFMVKSAAVRREQGSRPTRQALRVSSCLCRARQTGAFVRDHCSRSAQARRISHRATGLTEPVTHCKALRPQTTYFVVCSRLLWPTEHAEHAERLLPRHFLSFVGRTLRQGGQRSPRRRPSGRYVFGDRCSVCSVRWHTHRSAWSAWRTCHSSCCVAISRRKPVFSSPLKW
jgi:hypothetical protein